MAKGTQVLRFFNGDNISRNGVGGQDGQDSGAQRSTTKSEFLLIKSEVSKDFLWMTQRFWFSVGFGTQG